MCTRVIAACNWAGTRLCIAEELRDLETQLRRYITEVPLAVSRNVLARWRSLLSFRTDFIPQVLPALPAEPKPAAYDEAAKPSSLNQLALLNENDAFFANCLSGRSSCIERLAEVARRVSLSRASLAMLFKAGCTPVDALTARSLACIGHQHARAVGPVQVLLDGPVVAQNAEFFDKPPQTSAATPPHQARSLGLRLCT